MSPVVRPTRHSIVCEAAPNKKADSAAKRARQAEKRRVYNKARKSEVKTRMKKLKIDADFLYFLADAAVIAFQYGNPDTLCSPLVEAKTNGQDLLILRSENIEFVVSPYEADAQLAYLSSLEAEKGGIVAVISEDSDLLAYGYPTVVFKMDRYGNGEKIVQNKVFESASRVPSFQCFDKELFTAGCDFLPSVPGIGITKAYSLVSKYRNLDREILDKLIDIDLVVNFKCTEDCLLEHHGDSIFSHPHQSDHFSSSASATLDMASQDTRSKYSFCNTESAWKGKAHFYAKQVRRDLRLLQSAHIEEIVSSSFQVIHGTKPKQKVQLLESIAKAREHKKLRICVDSAMELTNEVVMSILFPAALFLIFSIVNIWFAPISSTAKEVRNFLERCKIWSKN